MLLPQLLLAAKFSNRKKPFACEKRAPRQSVHCSAICGAGAAPEMATWAEQAELHKPPAVGFTVLSFTVL